MDTTRYLSARWLLVLGMWMLPLGAVHAQVPPTIGGMTFEEIQREAARLGIDLSNPEQAALIARNMGISEARIQQLLATYKALAEGELPDLAPQQRREASGSFRRMTADEARLEARRFGIDLTDPAAAMRQARDAGVSEAQVLEMLRAVQAERPSEAGAAVDLPAPNLMRLPEIMPASLDFTGEAANDVEVVSVAVTFRLEGSTLSAFPGAGQSSRMRMPGTARQGRPDSVLVLGGERMSPPAGVALYFLSPSRRDTVRAAPVQRLIEGADGELWMGTALVPAGVEPGAWTLVVVALDEQGEQTSLLDPAGILRIEGRAAGRNTHFGYDTFRRKRADAESEASGPVSDGYVVGAGDELRLTVWGSAEFQHDLTVDPEGRVFVPTVGQFTVAGKRLDDLRRDVRGWLSQRYSGLTEGPPSVFMDLTVARVKPMRVFILGEVEEPGNYTVPSGSSVFDALYHVGGPLTRGSLRRVQVVRGERAAPVDLYDFLLRGGSSRAVVLQTGDRIFIPPRGNTVTITGAVRRPAIYEMNDGETVADLVAYAGGLIAEAYTSRFQIERIIPFAARRDPAKTRTVLDFSLADVLAGRDSVALYDGDQVQILTIPAATSPAARSAVPAVKVAGAVYNPGRFELSGSIRTIRDLVDRADGLTGDAFLPKAELVRTRGDYQREMVAIDLEKVLADVPTHNLVLRAQDSLYVHSVQEMRGRRSVAITGQVRRPGEYVYYEGMSVGDLLSQGGGLYDPEFRKEVLMGRADVFRRSADGSTERIIPFDLAEALDGGAAADLPLRPEDELRVYPAEVNHLRERFIVISGAVKKPGTYAYREGMRLEDLILQAEGFNEDANRSEIQVTRVDGASGSVAQLRVPFDETLAFAAGERGGLFASSDSLHVASASSGFSLAHRDRIYVRSIPQFYKDQRTARIHGEVVYPGEYTLLHPNETVASLVDRAGGVLSSGYTGGMEILRDGERIVVDAERALGGDRAADLILLSGDEIVIPAKPSTVAVLGNVGQETHIKFQRGRRVSYYLDRAGGLRPGTEAVLLTQPSGATFRLSERGLLPRENPMVEDGAVIRATIVPLPGMDDTTKIDWSRTIRDSIALLSGALTIVLLYKRL